MELWESEDPESFRRVGSGWTLSLSAMLRASSGSMLAGIGPNKCGTAYAVFKRSSINVFAWDEPEQRALTCLRTDDLIATIDAMVQSRAQPSPLKTSSMANLKDLSFSTNTSGEPAKSYISWVPGVGSPKQFTSAFQLLIRKTKWSRRTLTTCCTEDCAARAFLKWWSTAERGEGSRN